MNHKRESTGIDNSKGIARAQLFENSNSEWLTTAEAADYLRVSRGTLLNMASNGQVIVYKLGRRNRYHVEDLRSLLFSERRGGFNGSKVL